MSSMDGKIHVVNPLEHLPAFNCFACSQHHPQGLKLKFFQEGERLTAHFAPRPDLSGIPNILHGGIQATLLDEVMWWAVFHFKQRFCVTQDLHLQFKSAVKSDMDVTLSARISREEKNLVHAEGELRFKDRLLVESRGSYFLPNQKLIARTQGMSVGDLPEEIKKYLPT